MVNNKLELIMSKQAEQALNQLMDDLRAKDPMVDDKMTYWNNLEQQFNTTGLSLMQLNETLKGQIEAADICKKISAAMVAKFGEE